MVILLGLILFAFLVYTLLNLFLWQKTSSVGSTIRSIFSFNFTRNPKLQYVEMGYCRGDKLYIRPSKYRTILGSDVLPPSNKVIIRGGNENTTVVDFRGLLYTINLRKNDELGGLYRVLTGDKNHYARYILHKKIEGVPQSMFLKFSSVRPKQHETAKDHINRKVFMKMTRVPEFINPHQVRIWTKTSKLPIIIVRSINEDHLYVFESMDLVVGQNHINLRNGELTGYEHLKDGETNITFDIDKLGGETYFWAKQTFN